MKPEEHIFHMEIFVVDNVKLKEHVFLGFPMSLLKPIELLGEEHINDFINNTELFADVIVDDSFHYAKVLTSYHFVLIKEREEKELLIKELEELKHLIKMNKNVIKKY